MREKLIIENISSQNSIEVSRTSKRTYSFSVKRYYKNNKAEAIKDIAETMEILKDKFRDGE
jgi:hypothetical protein